MQHDDDIGIRMVDPDTHLEATALRGRHHAGPGPAGLLGRMIRRTAVGHDDVGDLVVSARGSDRRRHVIGLVEGRDHHRHTPGGVVGDVRPILVRTPPGLEQ